MGVDTEYTLAKKLAKKLGCNGSG